MIIEALIKENIPFYWTFIIICSLINTFADVVIGIIDIFTNQSKE